MEQGILKDEKCNRNGCKGTIKEKDLDGSCSCHINPPCGYCETPKEYCPECDWDAEEEKQEVESKSSKNYDSFKIETIEERKERLEKRYSLDDGKLYKVVRYFDSVKEGISGKDLKLGDAYKLLDKLNSKERYYVSYSLKEQ